MRQCAAVDKTLMLAQCGQCMPGIGQFIKYRDSEFQRTPAETAFACFQPRFAVGAKYEHEMRLSGITCQHTQYSLHQVFQHPWLCPSDKRCHVEMHDQNPGTSQP